MRKVASFLFDALTLRRPLTFRELMLMELISFIIIAVVTGNASMDSVLIQYTHPMCIIASIGAGIALIGFLLPKKWFNH